MVAANHQSHAVLGTGVQRPEEPATVGLCNRQKRLCNRQKRRVDVAFDEDFVEKPPRDEAPSNLVITGRYVLTPEIFDLLESTEPGVGGELQLTDAICKLPSIRGVELQGDRFDIGNIPDWLQANIQIALTHDDGDMNEAVEALHRSQLDE